MMKRALEIGLALLIISFVVPSLCLAENSPGVEPSAEFSVKATNGYLISIENVLGSTSIVVTREDNKRSNYSFAQYSTKDRAPSLNRIEAHLGDLGSISMRFEPDGEVDRRTAKRSKDCGGPQRIVRRTGSFVGVIQFNGEAGYTTVDATEANGSIGTPRSYFCLNVDESPRRRPFLQIMNKQHTLGMTAIKTEMRGLTRLEAASIEKKDGVEILRYVNRIGFSSAFNVSSNLRMATVAPPPPFSGAAVLQRTKERSQPDWSGSLTVSFIGRPDVALTGREFTFANLSLR